VAGTSLLAIDDPLLPRVREAALQHPTALSWLLDSARAWARRDVHYLVVRLAPPLDKHLPDAGPPGLRVHGGHVGRLPVLDPYLARKTAGAAPHVIEHPAHQLVGTAGAFVA
jgi:hypothetical protein